MRTLLLLGAIVVLAGCSGGSPAETTQSPVIIEEVYTPSPAIPTDGNATPTETATPTSTPTPTPVETDTRDEPGNESESDEGTEDDGEVGDGDAGNGDADDDQEDVEEFWDAVGELMRELEEQRESEDDE